MHFAFKLLTAAVLAEQSVNALELAAQDKSSSVHAQGTYSVPEAYRVYASPSPHLQSYGHGYGGYGGNRYSSYSGSSYGNTSYGHGTSSYGSNSRSYGGYGASRTSYGSYGNNFGSSYSRPSYGGYSHCDADCEAKVGEVKAAMAGKLQDTADTCEASAEALREEIVEEIRALRVQLSGEAQDRAQASVDKLSEQVDMDLAMLLDTFNTLKGEIDEEKHSIAEQIEKLAWETKSKISKIKGYRGGHIGAYGGYSRHSNFGYSQPSYGYSGHSSSYGYGHDDVSHGGYGPSTSKYGHGGHDEHQDDHDNSYLGSNYSGNHGSNYGSRHGSYAVPAKGYLGYGDAAYTTGPIEKKNEGPHVGLYNALLFA